MTGKQTIKEQANEKARGKKRYLERLAEEAEADKDIQHFLLPQSEDIPINEEYKNNNSIR